MLTRKDVQLISLEYFVILKRDRYYIEVMSKSIGYCWIIYKHGSVDKYPVWVYHKHRQQDQCYHLHRRTGSIYTAIKEIKSHDDYQCNGRKNIFSNLC